MAREKMQVDDPMKWLVTRAQRSGHHSQAPRRSRGQSLVEFALISPVFLLLLFGVIEYSLINASIGAFNFAAKEGARYVAILGNGAPPAPNSATPLDQYMIQNEISPHTAGYVMAQAQEVIIYKSDETGNCITGGGPPPCTGTQDVWTFTGGAWTNQSDSYPPGTRNTELSNADYIGVYIAYQYTYLTAFFAITSPTLNLTAVSVQRIEPQQYGQREAPAQLVSARVGAGGRA